MTLPASGAISIGQVAAELGIGLPLSLGDSRVRTLAGVATGPISLSNLYGKSNGTPLAATSQSDSNYADSSVSGGTVGCSPSVAAGGGTGPYTYAWSFTSNPSGCALANSTSAAPTVSKSYTKSAVGSASATLQCVITDSAAASITKTGITADLGWGF